MAMKKTSGGDSPLRQGAGKSFWTLPILGRRRRRIAMHSGKVIGCLGFPVGGSLLAKGQRQKWTRGPTPQAGAGQGQAAPPGGVAALWLLSVCSLVLWKLR
jgi:hypothetical protein